MTAVVLCTGPSLAKLDKLPACDVSIAVKRAAARFACDWVAILDIPVMAEIEAELLGNPRLLTRRPYRPKYTKRTGFDVEDLAGPHREGFLTAPTAVCLAVHLGATKVKVYGADWTNTPDFDGHVPAEMSRDAARWDRELGVWMPVVEWAEERGTTVTRI